MSSIKKNVGLEISHHLYLFSVKMYDWLKEKFGSMVRKLINTTHYSRCFHCQMKLKPVLLSSKHFVLFSKKRDGFFNTKLNDRRCLKLWNTYFWYPGSYHQASGQCLLLILEWTAHCPWHLKQFCLYGKPQTFV